MARKLVTYGSARMALGPAWFDHSALDGTDVDLRHPSALQVAVRSRAPYLGRVGDDASEEFVFGHRACTSAERVVPAASFQEMEKLFLLSVRTSCRRTVTDLRRLARRHRALGPAVPECLSDLRSRRRL